MCCAMGARFATACSTKVLSSNLTNAFGRFAPKRFPAPAAAMIAAVLLIMTVNYCQLRGENLI